MVRPWLLIEPVCSLLLRGSESEAAHSCLTCSILCGLKAVHLLLEYPQLVGYLSIFLAGAVSAVLGSIGLVVRGCFRVQAHVSASIVPCNDCKFSAYHYSHLHVVASICKH